MYFTCMYREVFLSYKKLHYANWYQINELKEKKRIQAFHLLFWLGVKIGSQMCFTITLIWSVSKSSNLCHLDEGKNSLFKMSPKLKIYSRCHVLLISTPALIIINTWPDWEYLKCHSCHQQTKKCCVLTTK